MERGLLMLRQPQRPSLTTPTDIPPTATMAMERGLLMLRQPQRPSLTTPTVTPPTATMAMERGLLMLRQPQRPNLTTPTDILPTATMAMERGPLMLRLSPRPMPGMDMVGSMATDTQSTAMVMVFMESGLLKPSQRPSLTMPMDTPTMATERGLLRPHQRPSLTTPTDMDILPMDTTGVKLFSANPLKYNWKFGIYYV